MLSSHLPFSFPDSNTRPFSFFCSDFPTAIQAVQSAMSNLNEDVIRECGDLRKMLTVLDTFTDLEGAINKAADDIGSINVDASDIQAGIISWQHSITLAEIDMPCYEGLDTAEFSPLPPIKYPKFSSCSKVIKLPLPNGHVPYLR